VIARRAFAQDADGGTNAGAMSLLAPLVLASSLLFFALSRALASDAFLAAAVVGFWVAHLSPRHRDGVLPLAALGLGFFIKGPVVFLHTLVPALVGAWIARDRAPLQSFRQGWGWLLFAMIGLGWYVAEAARVPGLAMYWLQNQLWERYTTTVHHRGGPWYYFAVALVAGALPWTAAVVAGAWSDAKRASQLAYVRAALLAWIVLPPLFFSTSGSKLATYVLPEMPAVAIFAAAALHRGVVWARVSAALLTALAVALEIAGPTQWAKLAGASSSGGGLPWPLHLAAVVMVAAALALVARRVAPRRRARGRRMARHRRRCSQLRGRARRAAHPDRASPEGDRRSRRRDRVSMVPRGTSLLSTSHHPHARGPARARLRCPGGGAGHAHARRGAHHRHGPQTGLGLRPRGRDRAARDRPRGRFVPWATWRGREVARIEAIE
jgi:4-amino-4-deoxy-L-arabinose transferase-like glycosyltransferase